MKQLIVLLASALIATCASAGDTAKMKAKMASQDLVFKNPAASIEDRIYAREGYLLTRAQLACDEGPATDLQCDARWATYLTSGRLSNDAARDLSLYLTAGK